MLEHLALVVHHFLVGLYIIVLRINEVIAPCTATLGQIIFGLPNLKLTPPIPK